MKVFFTYVWGKLGDPAWPLSFTTKQARRQAKENLAEGDLVFVVGTKGKPTPPEDQGRVVGVYQVSDLEVNTQDYDVPTSERDLDKDGNFRFPFALHPITVWQITDAGNHFADLVGTLLPQQYLLAQTSIVKLDSEAAKPLLRLDRKRVSIADPATEFGKGRVQNKITKLAPKHEGSFSGAFTDHENWYVYTLVLYDSRKQPLAVKIGYSHNPQEREDAYNKPLAHEVSGLLWKLDTMQPVANEDTAREAEQAVLNSFDSNRLNSNIEIIRNTKPLLISAKIGTILRDMKVNNHHSQ